VNDLAVGRVMELVKGLRSFGRPDRADIAHVDLHEGIDAAVTLLRHEMRDRIDVIRDYGRVPEIECYPHQLNQVFMNLLLNAVQAIEGRGTITVRTRFADDAATVEIEDSGTGILEQDLSLIFEPGFTTRGERVGMGLGLLIARQVVDRHGGRITVSSVRGQGTTFTVRLPARLTVAGTPTT
ncbi:MAG: sensor histidine kinase, partial [Longimicrobiales bacterium]